MFPGLNLYDRDLAQHITTADVHGRNEVTPRKQHGNAYRCSVLQ